MVCPQNGTAVLKGLSATHRFFYRASVDNEGREREARVSFFFRGGKIVPLSNGSYEGSRGCLV